MCCKFYNEYGGFVLKIMDFIEEIVVFFTMA